MSRKKKTLTSLIANRRMKMEELLDVNQQIEDLAWDTKVDALYKVTSTAEHFKNDNSLELRVINESFFQLDRPGYAFAEVNMAPEDFQRFIVACIESHQEFMRMKRSEGKEA